MKQLTIIIFTTFILTSCSNEKTKTSYNNLNQSDSLKKTFIPILKGVWVLTDYIKEIERTKSPFQSSDKLNGVVTMIIDGKIQGDSIEVGGSWDNHQGYSFTTYFALGQSPNNLKTNISDYHEESNYYELGYEVVNKDTVLFLYHYSKTNKLLDRKQFTKISESQRENDAAWGLQYITNEKLFSGNYILIDSINSKTKVQFKNDGSLTGFEDFTTYSVFTDFVAPEPGDDVSDGICFEVRPNREQCFSFEIKTDTLFLTQGQLKYILVRQ